MRIVKASNDDHLGIKDTKENFFKIYESLTKEAQASNPDTVHDILLNPEGPSTETQLEGQRYTQKINVNPSRSPYNPSPDNTQGRQYDGQVGQSSDTGMSRTMPGEVGQMGPKEVAPPFAGDVVRNQFEEIGGVTQNQSMIQDQENDPSLNVNHSKDSLGPDSANTIEKQLHSDPVYGRPPSVTNNKKWQKKTIVGPPVSRKKRTKQ